MTNDQSILKQASQNGSFIPELDIYKCYKGSKYLSIKHSSYFQVYEELLTKYKGKMIAFVEVGVLNGGSLFMWRKFFGSEARIIGIDLNPTAKRWEKDSFEIHIGNQADPKFWDNLFSTIGDVDVILDDGGHTNEQQIITTHKTIPHIKDGGMLIIEDTNTSYSKEFGNPSKYSFINYSKTLIDSINSRCPSVRASKNILNQAVYSMWYYESIVCFNIDRKKSFISSRTSNEGISFNAEDLRHQGSNFGFFSDVRRSLREKFYFLRKYSFVKVVSAKLFETVFFILSRLRSLKLKEYFH